jgi:hypothetical protein
MSVEYHEERKQTLTEADLEELKKIVSTHSSCHLGLTPDEVSTLKRILFAFDGAASTIGKTILVTVVGVAMAIITKGFWSWLIDGIKRGG